MLSLNKPQMTVVKVEPKTNFKFVLKDLRQGKFSAFFSFEYGGPKKLKPKWHNFWISVFLMITFQLFFKELVLNFFELFFKASQDAEFALCLVTLR